MSSLGTILEDYNSVQLDINDQTQMLLNYPIVNDMVISKPLTLHFLQAAKSLIPKNWKSSDAPTLAYWFSTVEEIKQMENITHIIHNKSGQLWEIWAPWINYIETFSI
ncbi:hypothetical protein XELAEV_18005578mg [Xenopus laevis]|uniref:Uncharacterized protein n=1 Tax=Xenopus laevis TaxID=8355 RepID=A0A974I2S0_XENLA|nr:hypothetical protein XELAEV_18005578mg [Xenopus laevis]